MDAIFKNLDNVFNFKLLGQYRGNDVLLILGSKSYKYHPDTFVPIFPNMKKENVIVIPGAGHWVHAEKPKETVAAMSDFLLYLDCAPKYGFSTVIHQN